MYRLHDVLPAVHYGLILTGRSERLGREARSQAGFPQVSTALAGKKLLISWSQVRVLPGAPMLVSDLAGSGDRDHQLIPGEWRARTVMRRATFRTRLAMHCTKIGRFNLSVPDQLRYVAVPADFQLGILVNFRVNPINRSHVEDVAVGGKQPNRQWAEWRSTGY